MTDALGKALFEIGFIGIFKLQIFFGLVDELYSVIYFLFDIRKIEQDKKAIKARMMKIWSHISKHNIENVSMQLVATHFDEYVKVSGGTECAARSEALRTLELKSLFDKLQKKKKIEMSDDFLMVGSLLDDKFVESIKDCIIKSSE